MDDQKRDPEQDEGPKEEVVVPVAMRPFLDKEINFQLFLELLADKVDK